MLVHWFVGLLADTASYQRMQDLPRDLIWCVLQQQELSVWWHLYRSSHPVFTSCMRTHIEKASQRALILCEDFLLIRHVVQARVWACSTMWQIHDSRPDSRFSRTRRRHSCWPRRWNRVDGPCYCRLYPLIPQSQQHTCTNEIQMHACDTMNQWDMVCTEFLASGNWWNHAVRVCNLQKHQVRTMVSMVCVISPSFAHAAI